MRGQRATHRGHVKSGKEKTLRTPQPEILAHRAVPTSVGDPRARFLGDAGCVPKVAAQLFVYGVPSVRVSVSVIGDTVRLATPTRAPAPDSAAYGPVAVNTAQDPWSGMALGSAGPWLI